MAQEAVGSSPITHPIDQKFISGCGAVRLAHLLWEQGVGSSNLSTPTRGRPLKSDDKPLLTERLFVLSELLSFNTRYTNNGHKNDGHSDGHSPVSVHHNSCMYGFIALTALYD